MNPIRRALISVSNKKGILEFAKGLSALNVEIISTGGTANALRDAKIPVREISELTGFPEILDGRVKTLHPKVHGGILGIRDNPAHRQQMAGNDITPIDLVVVNLYPFEEVSSRPGADFEEIIENIDIGGPAMIRSAAKNFHDVLVVVQPDDYDWVLEELKKNQLSLPLESRFSLAQKAFASRRDMMRPFLLIYPVSGSRMVHFGLARIFRNGCISLWKKRATFVMEKILIRRLLFIVS